MKLCAVDDDLLLYQLPNKSDVIWPDLAKTHSWDCSVHSSMSCTLLALYSRWLHHIATHFSLAWMMLWTWVLHTFNIWAKDRYDTPLSCCLITSTRCSLFNSLCLWLGMITCYNKYSCRDNCDISELLEMFINIFVSMINYLCCLSKGLSQKIDVWYQTKLLSFGGGVWDIDFSLSAIHDAPISLWTEKFSLDVFPVCKIWIN